MEEGCCTPFYLSVLYAPFYLKGLRNIDMRLDVDMGLVINIRLNIRLDVGTAPLDMGMSNVVFIIPLKLEIDVLLKSINLSLGMNEITIGRGIL